TIRYFKRVLVSSDTWGRSTAGEGLIDVHHTKPVHTLAEGEITRLEDLALLCSNCHRVVHSSRRWRTVEEVAALVRQS
ncbi:hypothetical protein EJ774_25340, partial [Pandoraea apista]